MTEQARFPKRAHILASINPRGNEQDGGEEFSYAKSQQQYGSAKPSPSPPSRDDERVDEKPADTNSEPRATKFRFKSKSSKSHRRSRSRDRNPNRDDEGHSPTHRRHHHRHHRPRRRRRSASPRSPAPAADDPLNPPPLDADAAFRASLFDAMADDEGAAYWEGVYGQPMHVYPRSGPTTNTDTHNAGNPGAEVDGMTDDEYAAFVRQRMWEKTHAGLVEERARRAAARERAARDEAEDARAAAEVERSLRRGEERRRRRAWAERWRAYGAAWAAWDGEVGGMAWPVEGGGRGGVGEEGAVRRFFVLGLGLDELGEREFAARLKDERVRWHPDKMQQRLGGKGDEAVMKDVTAVFQMIDRLWTDTRPKA